IGFLTDEDRVWPGQGAIDLDDHVSALKEIGYSDVVSVELFRPEYYKLSAEDDIQTAKKNNILCCLKLLKDVMYKGGVN
ncbi:hypothetical protein MMJ63_27110, partial [Bacillus vallismortis]|nr:hypothetical protein [Bacillus vallismortis]